MRALVLGCGPAGLIAANTCDVYGVDVTIFSRKVKSPIYGAQWIQDFIPEVTPEAPDGYIQFVMLGSEEGYAAKIFGDPNHGNGWHEHINDPMKPGWDLRRAYNGLWEAWEKYIIDKELDAEEVGRLDWESYDFIFSCVPLWNICAEYKPKVIIEDTGHWTKSAHQFDKYKVQIQPSAPAETDANRIIYNGRPEDDWFRGSQIFGIDGGYEYPMDVKVENATMVRKPQSTNCDCWPNVIRVGRYGRWEMAGLVHDGFTQVRDVLEKGR